MGMGKGLSQREGHRELELVEVAGHELGRGNGLGCQAELGCDFGHGYQALWKVVGSEGTSGAFCPFPAVFLAPSIYGA